MWEGGEKGSEKGRGELREERGGEGETEDGEGNEQFVLVLGLVRDTYHPPTTINKELANFRGDVTASIGGQSCGGRRGGGIGTYEAKRGQAKPSEAK